MENVGDATVSDKVDSETPVAVVSAKRPLPPGLAMGHRATPMRRVERDSLYNRISNLLLAGATVNEIAEMINRTPSALMQIMQRPTFKAVHRASSDSYYADLRAVARDHTKDMMLRKAALASRGVEALDHALEVGMMHLRTHGGAAKATMVRALNEAAIAAIDRDPAEKKKDREASGAKIVNAFQITSDKVGFFQSVIAESGVDLGYVFKDYAQPMIEGEIVDDEDDDATSESLATPDAVERSGEAAGDQPTTGTRAGT